MTKQTQAARPLREYSSLNDADSNRLHRAKAVAQLIGDLANAADWRGKSGTVQLETSALVEAMCIITDELKAVHEGSEAGWKAMREHQFVPFEIMIDMITESLQPTVVPDARMQAAATGLESSLHGSKLEEMRAMWQTLQARRRAVSASPSIEPSASNKSKQTKRASRVRERVRA